MDHKEELDKLHQESLTKLDDYMAFKAVQERADHENIRQLKKEWEQSWNKLMETLLVIERLEI
jgi:hypothetical protein